MRDGYRWVNDDDCHRTPIANAFLMNSQWTTDATEICTLLHGVWDYVGRSRIDGHNIYRLCTETDRDFWHFLREGGAVQADLVTPLHPDPKWLRLQERHRKLRRVLHEPGTLSPEPIIIKITALKRIL